MSAYEYLQEMRLERGRTLLLDTDLQNQLIADRIGYRNAGDFIRAFRRHFGGHPGNSGRGDCSPMRLMNSRLGSTPRHAAWA